MTLSNYEIMRNQMRGEFAKCDQKKMIHKFKLKYDDSYLYLKFVGRDYRIHRQTGVVEWTTDAFQTVTEADYNESMTIYDVLGYSKDDCRLAGKFCPIHYAKGITSILAPGSTMFQKSARRFQGHMEELRYACHKLGKPVNLIGDLSFELQIFPFFSVILQYWDGDEEFPPSMKFMYDENILDYMHFETVFFMVSHILKRLEEIAGICRAVSETQYTIETIQDKTVKQTIWKKQRRELTDLEEHKS